MKKILALSLLAATVFGGMVITQPAEAYGCHRDFHHRQHHCYHHSRVRSNLRTW
jgi:hypothetical protein